MLQFHQPHHSPLFIDKFLLWKFWNSWIDDFLIVKATYIPNKEVDSAHSLNNKRAWQRNRLPQWVKYKMLFSNKKLKLWYDPLSSSLFTKNGHLMCHMKHLNITHSMVPFSRKHKPVVWNTGRQIQDVRSVVCVCACAYSRQIKFNTMWEWRASPSIYQMSKKWVAKILCFWN